MALLESDVEMNVAEEILDTIREKMIGETRAQVETTGELVQTALHDALYEVISVGQFDFDERVVASEKPVTIVFTGVNGVGKTTSIAKMARYFENEGLSVVMANGDTYRAGANEQIQKHAENLGKRIISHEVASVADETSKTLTALNPAVGYVEWNLSPRHPAPDVCDVLATQDLYGAGPGVYPTAVVPSLPHPHCLCNTRAIVRSPSEWTTENEVPDEPDIDENAVRELMEEVREEGQRSITDAHVSSQTEALQEILSQVHENPRGA
jgi:broad-specificity NMP kinase